MKIFNRFMATVISVFMGANVLYAQEAAILGSANSQPTISIEQALQQSVTPPLDEQIPGDFLNQTSPLSAATSSAVINPDVALYVLGIQEGATVSGLVSIRPNPATLPNIKKVSYYLNDSQSGKVYNPPFIWGGPSGDGTVGFDTRNLPDGNYTLNMAYTNSAGDQPGVHINFKVKNQTTTPPPPICEKSDYEKLKKEKKELKEKEYQEKKEKEDKEKKDKGYCKKKN